MKRFICSFDIDDDLARVHLATPKMLAPQSRLADLSNTVIPEQLRCIRLARGKFKLTNQDSAAEKKLVSSPQRKLTGKALKSGIFSHWRWHKIYTKGD